MKLSQLFANCAWDVIYKQVGDSVNYAFVEDNGILYIYFEGSNSITDWVRNFLFKKKPYKDMDVKYKVHRGFLAAWKTVEDIIINKITEQVTVEVYDEEKKRKKIEKKYKYNKIYVVGYSHGGALAAFCHECVWFHRPDLRDGGFVGYGFEAPRIYGAWHVKKSLKERWDNFYVIRTNNDIVTHCPPRLFRFTHVGHMIKVKGNTKLVKEKHLKCIKSHFPRVVYDALLKYEEEKGE